MQTAARTYDPEATVLAHQPLARRLARRYARGDADLQEELEQVAALGLVKAARRFDPARGTAFPTFAIPTVLGELRRHFRSTRWVAHVPRRLQESYLTVRETEIRLTAERGRTPSAAELAAQLAWTVEELLEVRSAASALAPVSLDAPMPADDDPSTPLADRLGVDDGGYAAAELRDELEQAIALLDPPADEAVRLRFQEQLTVKEVAARIGVSPSHASKLVERSLATLRTLLQPQAA
jgi:RNA polymerase sigma-B factor